MRISHLSLSLTLSLTHTHTLTLTLTHTQTHTHTNTHTHVHTHTQTNKQTNKHTHIFLCMYTACIVSDESQMCTWLHTHLGVYVAAHLLGCGYGCTPICVWLCSHIHN